MIQEKSYSFAIDIICAYKELKKSFNEYDLFRQLLRSGTSIGANVHEATSGQTRKDFLSKLYISYKEARETLYWINLLYDTGYLSKDNFENLKTKCNELIKILSSITKTTSETLSKK